MTKRPPSLHPFLIVVQEATIGGKKKASKIGKLSINLESCAKADTSQFALPFVMEPKYLRGAEPPVFKVRRRCQ